MPALRVLLVDMPFASIGWPSLGLASLQAALRQAAVECDVLYANVAFAREIGVAAHERIARELPNQTLAGEWVFAACLFEGGRRLPGTYVQDVLEDRWRLGRDDVDLVLSARDAASGFLDRCLASVSWKDYDLVGFTSCGSQNVASLALARRVKERHPDVVVAFGGSNWDEGVGLELHRQFDFVDVGLSGEAEESLPALVRWLRQRTSAAGADLQRIPGVISTLAGRSRIATPAAPVENLDALPLPDYDDYFDALDSSGLTRRAQPSVLVETCRGCWWAVRHPCRFCGSPGCRRAYRTKTPARIIAELRSLAALRRCRWVFIVDDVPSPQFFDEVLPELAADPLPVPLFCEVRPDVRREHIAMLGRVGATIQPGIESLSDNVLRLMCKGSRGLENVRLMRWCREHGVGLTWNLMYGIPGERPADYEQMLSLLPAMRFLEPPADVGPVRLDRFSDYATRPDSYGWHHVRPLQAYGYIYPFSAGSLRRLAYAFDYEWEPGHDPERYTGPLRREIDDWRQHRETGEPRLVECDGGRAIVDTRDDPPRLRYLDEVEAAVYEACDDISGREDLERRVAAAFADDPRLAARIDAALESFLRDRSMVRDGDRYLSLALRDTTVKG